MFIDDKDILVEVIHDEDDNVWPNWGVKATHIPTGISASSSEKIGQWVNRQRAIELLNIRVSRTKGVKRRV